MIQVFYEILMVCACGTAWRPHSLGCTDVHQTHLTVYDVLVLFECSSAWRPKATLLLQNIMLLYNNYSVINYQDLNKIGV